MGEREMHTHSRDLEPVATWARIVVHLALFVPGHVLNFDLVVCRVEKVSEKVLYSQLRAYSLQYESTMARGR
jgi:hypothetical protein